MPENPNQNGIFMKELSIYQLIVMEMNGFLLLTFDALHMVQRKQRNETEQNEIKVISVTPAENI